MKFDFAGLKKSLSSIRDQIIALRQKIEGLKQERENVQFAPPTRSDMKQLLAAWIDERKGQHQALVPTLLNMYARNARLAMSSDISRIRLASLVGVRGRIDDGTAATVNNVDNLLCFVIPDLVAAALNRAVDDMEWPDATALPLADRASRLEALDSAIEKAESELRECLVGARAAGINIEGM